jgi:hypothetical protein
MTPATNRQVPEHSIVDHFNKQAYLGNQYIANTNVVTVTGTTEVPVLYIANPALVQTAPSNGIALFNEIQTLACIDPSGLTGIVYRIYSNPTVVAGGSAIVPRNCRLASSNTSIATCLKSPTVTTMGTLLASLNVGSQNTHMGNLMFIVDPNKSILITAQPSATTSALVVCSWYEL